MTSAVDRANLIGDVFAGQTVAGSAQADAAPMRADHVQVASASAGQGVIVRPGNSSDLRSVANASSVNIYVYPPVGTSFNGAAANAPVDLPAKSAALFIFVTGSKINAII
jgi:hypothetical protein